MRSRQVASGNPAFEYARREPHAYGAELDRDGHCCCHCNIDPGRQPLRFLQGLAMYKKYYGLARNPFELSPDPFFYFPSPRHNEALATLTYGILNRKGFVVVTGEVGTGKTLLVRCLLDTLTRNRVAFAFVYNPLLSVQDFLSHVLTDFGLTKKEGTKSELLASLNSFVMVRSWRDGTTALIIDEAQLLSWELLEEIRLLTNLETTQHKLLQIVLVGQPELDEKLDSQELRQLKQRIGMRCRLDPLNIEEL